MYHADPDKEEVIRDKDGQLVRVHYDDELVFHRFHECVNCSWTGEIDLFPEITVCPDCGSGRGEHGLQQRLWYDGIWADDRLDDLKDEVPAMGAFNAE